MGVLEVVLCLVFTVLIIVFTEVTSYLYEKRKNINKIIGVKPNIMIFRVFCKDIDGDLIINAGENDAYLGRWIYLNELGELIDPKTSYTTSQWVRLQSADRLNATNISQLRDRDLILENTLGKRFLNYTDTDGFPIFENDILHRINMFDGYEELNTYIICCDEDIWKIKCNDVEIDYLENLPSLGLIIIGTTLNIKKLVK